ncbi:hypothetical protein M752DRAFT_270647 [Aspergillus phoenicis ATCC 13157]|uniref:Uncharacterized protein n=1 Tax=Aspergillus phoenicis ATCC 13157 TaxID=1353007 RepID=A0A370P6T1_ASPPH|nr:hypothetical protein M752DRAFT_270647 [Aspergillus phoenicis ATCC 13157]
MTLRSQKPILVYCLEMGRKILILTEAGVRSIEKVKNRNRPSERHRDHGSPYYGGKGILIDTAYKSNREVVLVVLVVWLGLKRVDPTSVCWISKLEVPIAARDWADAYARGPVTPRRFSFPFAGRSPKDQTAVYYLKVCFWNHTGTYPSRLHAGVPESRTIQDYLVGRLVVNSRKVWGSEPGKYNQPITSSGRTRYLVQM